MTSFDVSVLAMQQDTQQDTEIIYMSDDSDSVMADYPAQDTLAEENITDVNSVDELSDDEIRRLQEEAIEAVKAKKAEKDRAEERPEDEYEYWDGEANMWVKGDEHRATTLIEGTVGEASLMYMEKYDKWLAIYIDSRNGGISYRSADNITGPWSQSRPLIKRGEIPGCYGSFIHPACAKDDDGHIYWTMSIWGYYNVFLMKSSIRLDEEIRK